ncbi:MAG: isochorismatase family protein [Pirellulales bacterium]
MSKIPRPADAENRLPRSPELMCRENTALLVVDAQEKLLKIVPHQATIVWNIRRLLDAAAILGLPCAGTEQYPEKLSATVPELKQRLGPMPDKLAFTACVCSEIFERWEQDQRDRVLVCGIETHVCIAQTAFDLTAAGFGVYVAVDAVGSRNSLDHETALRRMESAGIVLTTAEAAIFEWCREAGTPEFKQISALAKETPPR